MSSTTTPTYSNFQLLVSHFYIGVLITIAYIIWSPAIIEAGFPGITALLAAELFILAPLVLFHLGYAGYKINGSLSMRGVILYAEPLSAKKFILWTLGGIGAILIIYLPLYPVGLALRQSVFDWLPEWYFNPTFGTDDLQLVANVFLAGILIDGIIGPVLEELFFRGYLLPRMKRFGKWAWVINGACFGLYHFWQPHNLIAIVAVGLILSFIVWKTRNVWLGIVIHCFINIAGALGGYLAASGGVFIGR